MPAPPRDPFRDSVCDESDATAAVQTPAGQALLASALAGVTTAAITEFAELTEVSRLLESVWGRSEEGVPINSDVLRSLAHAGGCVTGAYAGDGRLVGAAALSPGYPAHESYSLIAAAQSGAADRGIGAAIKLAQRAWALERGITTMRWTFDPLVSRNARFNLVKLGAYADVYEDSFYGKMSDKINGHDLADRLVATWQLDSPRVRQAVERISTHRVADGPSQKELLSDSQSVAEDHETQPAPDGKPGLIRSGEQMWCRVPADIVALRSTDPDMAMRWRMSRRKIFHDAFAGGLVATSISRDAWYHLTLETRRSK